MLLASSIAWPCAAAHACVPAPFAEQQAAAHQALHTTACNVQVVPCCIEAPIHTHTHLLLKGRSHPKTERPSPVRGHMPAPGPCHGGVPCPALQCNAVFCTRTAHCEAICYNTQSTLRQTHTRSCQVLKTQACHQKRAGAVAAAFPAPSRLSVPQV